MALDRQSGRTFGDVSVTVGPEFVGVIEVRRPPHNFMDIELIASMAEALEFLADEPSCRAAVLAAEGKNWSAGSNMSPANRSMIVRTDGRHLYDEAARIIASEVPVIAACQGAVVGGGVGLALACDLRVASDDARFSVNFARLGTHQGFGLSFLLPRAVGPANATRMLLTGARITADEARSMGLVDEVVPRDELPAAAHRLARQIAECAPLSLKAIRRTLRADLVEHFRSATAREKALQEELRATEDHREGVASVAERRVGDFQGR